MPRDSVQLGLLISVYNTQCKDMQLAQYTHLGALQPASSGHGLPAAGWSVHSHPLSASEAGVASA